MIYKKNSPIGTVRQGYADARKIYLGDKLVWQASDWDYYVWRDIDKNGIVSLATGEFPSDIYADIKEIGTFGLSYAFYGCTGLTGSVSFPALTSVGTNGLSYAFSGCIGLTGSVSFPALTSVMTMGLANAFSGCTGLTGSVSFPSLTSVGTTGLTNAFSGCTGLTGSVSFPSLTRVMTVGLSNAFKGCIGITELHFRADAQSVIKKSAGYSSNFGATNATIYFDL